MYSFETAAWTTTADLTGLGTYYNRSRRIKMDSALNLLCGAPHNLFDMRSVLERSPYHLPFIRNDRFEVPSISPKKRTSRAHGPARGTKSVGPPGTRRPLPFKSGSCHFLN